MGSTVGTDLETIIGLEIHVQLLTATKLFCDCAAEFGALPNSRTCPVCLGLPGALPVLNGRAVDLALRTAVALGCRINRRSRFARKNYFYPDLPKGYQISQYDQPVAEHGRYEFLHAGARSSVRILRVHLEEDAGKSTHGRDSQVGRSFVDLNRCGTPLVEIVTEPDLRDPDQAAAFLESLRDTLRAISVTDASMQEGSLRCDANVSLRAVGAASLNPKTELKNLNSFRFLRLALHYEVERQAKLLHGGEIPAQSTRSWDEDQGISRVMRSKEDEHDYRYFPEPDLVPVAVGEQRLAAAEAAVGELPLQRADRLLRAHSLALDAAWSLAREPARADFFEELVGCGVDSGEALNWIRGPLQEWANDQVRSLRVFPLPAAQIARLQGAIDDGTVSRSLAKEVLRQMLESGQDALTVIREQGLEQLGDVAAIGAIVDEVLTEHPDEVASFRAGREQVLGFLMGQVMQRTQGRASPQVAREILHGRLAQ